MMGFLAREGSKFLLGKVQELAGSDNPKETDEAVGMLAEKTGELETRIEKLEEALKKQGIHTTTTDAQEVKGIHEKLDTIIAILKSPTTR